MADMNDRPTELDHEDAAATAPADPRKPYEPPRVLKKRSVARATLFTAMGPTSMALTAMG